MRTLLSNFKLNCKHLVVYLLLISFGFGIAAKPVLAQQEQPPTPAEYQKQYEQYQKAQAETQLTQTAQTPTASPGATESGQAKPLLLIAAAGFIGLVGLCKYGDDIPLIGGAVSFLTSPICDNNPFVKALSWFMDTVVKNLLYIVSRVLLYVVTIPATFMGMPTDRESVCTETQNQQERDSCTKNYEGIAAINPIYNDQTGLTSKFNLFTVADSSFNSLYQAIPQQGPVDYLAGEFNHNILGVKVANAQGAGTDLISKPVRQAWEKVRDLSYIAMVLVLITIGFMVMFRRRLDPRTVVTATNSLPKVAIALILITFSFALSGLFLDMIFILVDITRNWFSEIGNHAFLDGFQAFGSKAGGEIAWLPFFTLVSQSILRWGTMLVIIGGISLGTAMYSGPGGLIVAIILLTGLILFELIIRLSIFIIAIILFWTLFQRFIMILVFTIFSPVFFLLGAVPGFESTPISWAKRMLAATLTFPVILIFVYIALTFLTPSFPGLPIVAGSSAKAPPPIGGAGYFLNIPALIGVGLILFSLKVPAFIDDVLGLKDPLGKGGIGAGLLFAAAAIPTRAVKQGGDIGKSVRGINDLHESGKKIGGALFRGLSDRGYDRTVTHHPGGGVSSRSTPNPGLVATGARATRRLIPPFWRPKVAGGDPNRDFDLTAEQVAAERLRTQGEAKRTHQGGARFDSLDRALHASPEERAKLDEDALRALESKAKTDSAP